MSGSLTDVAGVLVGNVQDERALTGVTAVLFPDGAVCGVDVRGGAPGTRETDLLAPTAMIERIHGICLAGGSAYGLDAAAGVMALCEERGIGYRSRAGWLVPIVPSAIIFDLAIGDGTVRPDRAMGYAAAQRATSDSPREGNVGAGCGATVGKLAGIDRAMRGGIGNAARRIDALVVAVLVVCNAVGEVRDPATGERLAGARAAGDSFLDPIALLAERAREQTPEPEAIDTNTTLAVVVTNAALTKAEATKVAEMTHDGFARAIFPVHGMHDGDVVFAASYGSERSSVDLIGTLAAECAADAIVRAIRSASAGGGLPSVRDR